MKKLIVLTVVGTRPEIIRLSATIHKFENSKAIEHVLVHTGQNYDYELNEIFFKDFNIRKPDYFLNAAEESTMSTIGNILSKIDPVLETVQPDAFLVLGDTNSCLAAIAAKRRHIPVFHMEAGNRCFDQRVPEEINRKIVDHISDINMPYSDISREYLIREGFPPDRIIKIGSPMMEVINKKKGDIESSKILEKLNISAGCYFVVSAHREENVSIKHNLIELIDSLNAMANKYRLPLIFSTHPRTKKQIQEVGVALHPLVKSIKPIGFSDYIKLQCESKAVLSDSGTISEEASILDLKALNIRQVHERPEAMEEAAVMLVGLNKKKILPALELLEDQKKKDLRIVEDYNILNVSEKVVRIIMSYCDYVNREVWKL